jgi:hypothetical protein
MQIAGLPNQIESLVFIESNVVAQIESSLTEKSDRRISLLLDTIGFGRR